MYYNNDTSLIKEVTATNDLIKQVKANPKVDFLDYSSLGLQFLILLIAGINTLRAFKSPIRNKIRHLSKKDLAQTDHMESLLKELLYIAKCDRVSVALLHNGSFVGKDIHFDKLSVFYEVTNPNIVSIKDNIQAIKVSKVYKHMSSTSEDHFSKFSRDKEKDINPNFARFLDSIGIDTVYSRLLVDSQGIYGIIELHYVNTPNEIELVNANKIRELDIIFNKVSMFLENLIKPNSSIITATSKFFNSLKK